MAAALLRPCRHRDPPPLPRRGSSWSSSASSSLPSCSCPPSVPSGPARSGPSPVQRVGSGRRYSHFSREVIEFPWEVRSARLAGGWWEVRGRSRGPKRAAAVSGSPRQGDPASTRSLLFDRRGNVPEGRGCSGPPLARAVGRSRPRSLLIPERTPRREKEKRPSGSRYSRGVGGAVRVPVQGDGGRAPLEGVAREEGGRAGLEPPGPHPHPP